MFGNSTKIIKFKFKYLGFIDKLLYKLSDFHWNKWGL